MDSDILMKLAGLMNHRVGILRLKLFACMEEIEHQKQKLFGVKCTYLTFTLSLGHSVSSFIIE